MRATPCCISRIPRGIDRSDAARSLEALSELNELALETLATRKLPPRIQSYEMAYRLQTSAPELMDLSQEPKHILDKYGIKDVKEAALRQQLPAGAASRGTRRAFCAALPRSLGPACQSHQGRQGETVMTTDQASAALVRRSQTTWAAGGHAGRLGRRVRPHADGAGGQRRTRPPQSLLQRCGWQAAG